MSLDIQQISWPGWETVRLIGLGSFGAVYEIRRQMGGSEEKAALKVIQLPQSQHDVDEMYSNGYDEESVTMAFQSHLDSIIAEYSLMRKMNGHTNIVSCDDIRYVQHDDGIGWDIFIKMELLTPLTKVLPAQIDEQTVTKIARDICTALVLCSKSNILHRDVKPQNIFVSEFGDYKLGDFGIAKTVEKTSSGTKAGTGPFMAPEVVHYQPYGHSADIYSLGIVLYWLLNERRMPFMPLPPAKMTVTMEDQAKERRLRGEPLPPPAHGSETLKAIVLKACAYDPAQRYHTAAEMLQDLEKLHTGGSCVDPEEERRKAEEERKRKEAEEARRKAEEERLRKEREEQERLRKERQEQDRLARERAEREAKERAEQERLQKEQQTAPKPQKKKWWIGVVATVIGILLLAILLPKICSKQSQRGKLLKTIDASMGLTVGLKDDGTVMAIGDNYHGQCAVGNWSNIVAISVGWQHGLIIDDETREICGIANHIAGLRADGTVIATGKNDDGQCDVSAWSDIIAISAGAAHTVGLKSDGTVVAAGHNMHGQCDVSDWQDIIAVSTGGFYTVGLRTDGTVIATGNNDNGECDVSAWRDIIAVSTGGYHTVGLRADGTVIATGKNDDGQCDVSAWRDIVAVSVSDNRTVGLKTDGTVIATGKNDDGQCDVSDWQDIIAVSTGNYHTVGLKADGTVVATGQNYCGECDVSAWRDIVAVSVGYAHFGNNLYNHTIGLKSDGTVVAVGNNTFDQCDVSDWIGIKTD